MALARFTKMDVPNKYYIVLIGFDNVNILHPELFVARNTVKKDGNIVMTEGHYPKTYDIPDYELTNETAHAFTSHNQYYSVLTPVQKAMINSIKKFLNADEWRQMVIFHDTECRLNKQYSHGNHLHTVLQTKVNQISKHSIYRAMQTQVSKMGGTCSIREVKRDIEGFIHYLANDTEKEFLGANSDFLRELYKNHEDYANQKQGWEINDVEDYLDTDEQPQKKQAKFITDVMPQATTTPEQEMQVPTHLNKCKSAENVDFLTTILRQNKDCKDITALVVKYGLLSDTGKALCHIAISSNGKKTFDVAIRQLQVEQQSKPLGDVIQELSDNIDGYMSIRNSQALFNAWCREQHIKPKYYAMLMQLLLSGKSYKRIGLYLQGRPNSGKTALTNNMWKCINELCGRITKENFCFQDCAGKRVIIGEEVAITTANIDRYKDLLSGSTLKCEIKNGAPQDCTPSIVMLNSNIPYTLNISGDGIKQLNVRIYNIDKLRESRVLKHMTGHFHPRMFYQNVTPLLQEDIYAITQGNSDYTDEPIGYGQEFTGDWSDIAMAAEAATGDQIFQLLKDEIITILDDSDKEETNNTSAAYLDNNKENIPPQQQEIMEDQPIPVEHVDEYWQQFEGGFSQYAQDFWSQSKDIDDIEQITNTPPYWQNAWNSIEPHTSASYSKSPGSPNTSTPKRKRPSNLSLNKVDINDHITYLHIRDGLGRFNRHDSLTVTYAEVNDFYSTVSTEFFENYDIKIVASIADKHTRDYIPEDTDEHWIPQAHIWNKTDDREDIGSIGDFTMHHHVPCFNDTYNAMYNHVQVTTIKLYDANKYTLAKLRIPPICVGYNHYISSISFIPKHNHAQDTFTIPMQMRQHSNPKKIVYNIYQYTIWMAKLHNLRQLRNTKQQRDISDIINNAHTYFDNCYRNVFIECDHIIIKDFLTINNV